MKVNSSNESSLITIFRVSIEINKISQKVINQPQSIIGVHTMAEQESKKPQIDKRLEMLKSITKYLQSECTGIIEPWPGRKGPMITAFLKQNGNRQGPKGFETVKAFIKDVLDNLRNSSYYIRFTFALPDGSGGQKQQVGTLISITADGNLTFACRERYTSQFSTTVEKIERNTSIANISTTDEQSGGGQIAFNLSEIAEEVEA